MKLSTFNNFVVEFLERNSTDGASTGTELKTLWMEPSNQKHVKTFLHKSEKNNKDPNAPKKPQSAYLYFCNEHRAEVKSSLVNPTAIQVTTELGKRWKALNANPKKNQKELTRFANLAKEDKKRYEDSMQTYVPSEEFRNSRKKRQSGKGTKPKSSYLCFCSESRSRVKEELGEKATNSQVTVELGKRWQALKEVGGSEFDRYQAQAKQERDRFLADKQQTASVVVVKTRKPNAYQLYCSENREALKQQYASSEVSKRLSEMWKSLADDERAVFKQRATATAVVVV